MRRKELELHYGKWAVGSSISGDLLTLHIKSMDIQAPWCFLQIYVIIWGVLYLHERDAGL